MITKPQAEKYGGRLMFCEYLGDALTGKWYSFENVTVFESTQDSEQEEVKSTDHVDYMTVLDTDNTPGTVTFNLTVNRYTKRTLAIFHNGELAVKNFIGATVTNENVVAVAGGAAKLAYGQASSVVVQDVTDTTTYVEGTDYTVRTGVGFTFLEFPVGSALDGDTLHVDYTAAADSGDQLKGGVKSDRKISAIFEGKNRFTGEAKIIRIPKCSVAPSGARPELSSAAAENSATLTPIKLPTESAAYYIE